MALVNRSCTYCEKSFIADTREINRGNAKFCSLSCSGAYGNKLRKKPKIPNHKCDCCGKEIYRKPSTIRSNDIYCSTDCFYKTTHPLYTKEQLLDHIKKFFLVNNRVPTFKEFEEDTGYPNPDNYQRHFGTWNKAIVEAGFKPNNQLGYVSAAKDGHICYSYAELTIDNYLFENGIKHIKEPRYPNSTRKADWLIGNTYIEYFGIDTVRDNKISKRYQAIIKEKRLLCMKNNLKLIEIYPDNLSNLDDMLTPNKSTVN